MDLNNHEEIRSFNFDMMVPTLVIFILSLAYYYIKYRRLRNFHGEGNLSGRNSNLGQNPPVEDLPEFEELLNPNYQGENINEDTTIRYPDLDIEDLNKLNIFLQMTNLNTRKSFIVDKHQTIQEFKTTQVLPIVPNSQEKTVTFIFMGKKLDELKAFSEYREISNNSVIHAFVHSKRPQYTNQQGNDGNRSRAESNGNFANDPNAVHFNTIKTHGFILLFVIMFIALYKYKSNLFQRSALAIFQILIFVWLTQVSNTIAKVYIHRKIIW